MKLRNLIFALFLAIGAIGFTACTGDDGSQGPPGEPGEQGPPGEPGEPGADAGDVESNYAFLTNWGAASGMASCSSDVLTGTGVFPGPAELEMIVDANGNAAPVREDAVCNSDGTGALVSYAPDFNGDGTPDTAAIGLVFNITHKGAEEAVNTPVPGEGDANPRVMSVRKNFSGGTVNARLAATGASDEAFSRALLYHDCGVGTAPPNIAGEFRAVRIIETDTVLEISDGESPNEATQGTYIPIPATTITTTTHKVCVRLDSLPGVVKCFASVVVAGARAGMAAGTTETVGIYRDAELHAVAPMPAGTATTLTAITNADTTNLGILNLDENGDTTIDDDVVQGKVCNLFLETTDQ